jgi:hypothetical protein
MGVTYQRYGKLLFFALQLLIGSCHFIVARARTLLIQKRNLALFHVQFRRLISRTLVEGVKGMGLRDYYCLCIHIWGFGGWLRLRFLMRLHLISIIHCHQGYLALAQWFEDLSIIVARARIRPSSIAKSFLTTNHPILPFRRWWIIPQVGLVADGQTHFVPLHVGYLVKAPTLTNRADWTLIFSFNFLDLVISDTWGHKCFIFLA